MKEHLLVEKMSKPIDIPKGIRVMIEVDLRYWRGRLEPFQFIFKSERYQISRITRRRIKKHNGREMQHYWVKVRGQKGAFEMIQDLKSAIWTIRKVDELRKKPPKNRS